MQPGFLSLKCLIYFVLAGLPFCGNSQEMSKEYDGLIFEADSLLKTGQYLFSAQKYTAAFQSFGWKGRMYDRYNAARAWAFAGSTDSAFFQLERITARANFDNEELLTGDTAFITLQLDARWPALLLGVRKNGGFDERLFNQPLFDLIDSLKTEDQKWRYLSRDLNNAAVRDTLQIERVHQRLLRTDSLNYYRLKEIVAQHGFPDTDQVAKAGTHNFWLLIQHQDMHPAFQDSVLQLMEKAVKAGKTSAKDYAYLVDRVLVNTGKLQIYGTQMTLNQAATSYEPRNVNDPEHLNERRKSVGLGTIEDYIKTMNERYFGTLKKR